MVQPFIGNTRSQIQDYKLEAVTRIFPPKLFASLKSGALFTVRCLNDISLKKGCTLYSGYLYNVYMYAKTPVVELNETYVVPGEDYFEIVPESYFDSYLGAGDVVFYDRNNRVPKSVKVKNGDYNIRPVGVVKCIKDKKVVRVLFGDDVELYEEMQKFMTYFQEGLYYYIYNVNGLYSVPINGESKTDIEFIPILRTHFEVVPLDQLTQDISVVENCSYLLYKPSGELFLLQSKDVLYAAEYSDATCITDANLAVDDGSIMTINKGNTYPVCLVKTRDYRLYFAAKVPSTLDANNTAYIVLNESNFVLSSPLDNILRGNGIQSGGSSSAAVYDDEMY